MKSHAAPGAVKDFWKVVKEFFSSIPHQKAVQRDKAAIHHEDGAKDTNHTLLGEFNFSPTTSMEAALRNQCSVWRPGVWK